MTLCVKRLVVATVIIAVALLANVCTIANWLDRIGVVSWARGVRTEYLTGTAIAVIVTLLILLGPWAHHAIGRAGRCPVCDHLLLRRGRYCAECGSRV